MSMKDLAIFCRDLLTGCVSVGGLSCMAETIVGFPCMALGVILGVLLVYLRLCL